MTKHYRTVAKERKTSETQVRLSLALDGGSCSIDTGVGFFDHMLMLLAHHSRIGLTLDASGDTHVDDHHTVEDVGIVLGQALSDVLGDKKGIERFGFASIPMDEALVRVSVDLSGRSSLVYDVKFACGSDKIGTFDTQLVREFLTALVNNGCFNCHVELVSGRNNHHIAEAIFKALGRSLHQAVAITGLDLPSTKGVL